MSDGTETINQRRVDRLEIRVDEMTDVVSNINVNLTSLVSTVSALKEELEEWNHDDRVFRKETNRSIKCINDTWNGFEKNYGQLLRDLTEARAAKKKITIAWITAGGLAIGSAIWTWVQRHIGNGGGS